MSLSYQEASLHFITLFTKRTLVVLNFERCCVSLSDIAIAYLRRVHFVAFYGGRRYRDEAHLLAMSPSLTYRAYTCTPLEDDQGNDDYRMWLIALRRPPSHISIFYTLPDLSNLPTSSLFDCLFPPCFFYLFFFITFNTILFMTLGASSIIGSITVDRTEVLTLSEVADKVEISSPDGQETSQIGEKRKRDGSAAEDNTEKDEIETKKDESGKVVEVAVEEKEVIVDTVLTDMSDGKKEEKIENNNKSIENGNGNENEIVRTVVESQANKEEDLIRKPLAVTPNVHSVAFNGSSTRQPILTDR